MHGLIFETSIWLLAGSTRQIHWKSFFYAFCQSPSSTSRGRRQNKRVPFSGRRTQSSFSFFLCVSKKSTMKICAQTLWYRNGSTPVRFGRCKTLAPREQARSKASLVHLGSSVPSVRSIFVIIDWKSTKFTNRGFSSMPELFVEARDCVVLVSSLLLFGTARSSALLWWKLSIMRVAHSRAFELVCLVSGFKHFLCYQYETL